MSVQIVIPARLASTRLHEKLLLRVGGKSVLQFTYEAACRATIPTGVVVAVDHPRLAEEVESFGGRWLMTRTDCPSGTDRIAEAAEQLPAADVFVNVQGDEPEIDPRVVDRVAQLLLDEPQAEMATVGTPIRETAVLEDPSNVKIVLAAGQGRALYFSRSVVPHVRDGITPQVLAAEPPVFWHHLGIYAYRRSFLDWFTRQPPSPLETLERLEQLRAIEAGKRIIVARVETASPGIDTRADFEAFRARLEGSAAPRA